MVQRAGQEPLSEGEPDRYAVLGNPVAHSRSPEIHRLFAEQTGQHLIYTAILVEIGHFFAALREFTRSGGKGLNVTVPFKQDAWEAATVLSPRARRARAVNTLVIREGGTLFGDNTDGSGLIRDLCVNHGVMLRACRLLVIGAGGASRGVLAPLLEQGLAVLTIGNRTALKAIQLAEEFSDLGSVQGCGLADLAGREFDVVINATSAGLAGKVPDLPDGILARGAVCYDMIYGSDATAFVRWGMEHGAALALDGLGMLVEQAAESFHLWRGVRPQTAPVIRQLRSQGTQHPLPR
jgi:shikimate dehydrogenase